MGNNCRPNVIIPQLNPLLHLLNFVEHLSMVMHRGLHQSIKIRALELDHLTGLSKSRPFNC